MKNEKIDPDGMLKVNRELFSDLGKWLVTTGGTWFYLMGLGAVVYAKIRQIGEVIQDKLDMYGFGISMMLIGGSLLFINQMLIIKKKTANRKSKNTKIAE